ncbi:paraflagellar rod protein, putative [Bodo saltans]|uniref:Paraflagellar rod protein, putative n=1 Tax=Bodo saltans TaxID=75058 RepID=A0A0S4J193_BODSA|nr:paraflagellar rod protein, putative [Bodo saltans]|eukprot:CUG48932.1 paraflagellar rod protein, putative [Bodo saltans]
MSSPSKNLAAARKEADIQFALRRSCEDITEAARRTIRGSHLTTAKKRAEFRDLCKSLDDRLREFVEQCEAKERQQGSFAAFWDTCGLQLTTKELINPDKRCNLEPLGKFQDSVNTLRKLKKYATVRAGSPLAEFIDQALKAVDKSRTILSETNLDSTVWCEIPKLLLSLVGECIDHDQANEVVEEHHEQLKRLTFAADECAQQQQQAVIDGDMKQTEVLYFKRISIQESMVELFNQIYNTLDQYHADAFVQPMKKVHEVHSKSSNDISRVMKVNEALKQRVTQDIRTLQENQLSLRNDHNDAHAQFARFMDECGKSLETNQKQQDQCLAAIEELEKRLGVLGEERHRIVSVQLDTIEKEKRRVVDYNHFNAFVQQHTNSLQLTMQNAEAAEEVTDIFDEVLCSGCNLVEQHLKGVDKATDKERNNTHDERLKHFRGLYLTLGDLQYKKERNLEELDKKISQVHIQQEMAMETFNPKAKEYSQMKKELIKVREEMESQIDLLSQKATLHIEAFKPTEVALVESGRHFVHPVQELHDLNRNRQQKLLEYHNLMSTEGAQEPAVETEMQAIESMRAQIQPRKPRSSHGAPPLGSKRVGSSGSPTFDDDGSSPVRAAGRLA